MAEHRVELVQLVRARLQRLDPHPRGRGDVGEILLARRQKFVERRVEQTDRDRKPRHHLENSGEVGALFGGQFGERDAAARLIPGERTEERRGGKEWCSTGESRWWAYH